MKFPIQVRDGHGCNFVIHQIDPYASEQLHEQSLLVQLGDFRGGYQQLLLPTQFLLAVADTIYRVCGQTPREQPLRVEVALAPAALAAAAAPVLELVRLRDEAGEDVGAIKRWMQGGQ